MRQTRLRIHRNNKSYAMMAFYRVISLLICIIFFTFILDDRANAYVISLLLAPVMATLASVQSARLDKLERVVKPLIISADMKKFGFFVAFSGGMSQVQLYVDSLLVATLLQDPVELANYRIASLLPISFLIIPAAFLNSEYVELTKNFKVRKYIIFYIKNYMLLSLFLSFILVFITQLFGNEIILMLFSEKYIQSVGPFQVLIVGICGSFLFRQPFGILNNVSGRPDLNLMNSVFSIAITVILLFWLIPIYGLMGAAVSTSIMLWVSGLNSMALYYFKVYSKYTVVEVSK